ncbi:MAG: hypothetical protein P1V51_13405 [Deltaproteobacteria bacterium]|nr:hypothetical protein [Deltaproteobacteria bacterium]
MSPSRSLRTWLGGALWTALLVVGLFLLDRRVIAPKPPEDVWRQVSLETHRVGLPVLPAYLPASLTWPPAVVWLRGGEAPQEWLGLREEGSERTRIWIGWNAGSLPPALSGLAGCLQERALCPEGWRFLSTTLDDDSCEVSLLTDLDPREARRILQGLSPARPHELP